MILNMMSLHRKLITKAAQIGVRNIGTNIALKKNLYEVLGLTRDATQADIKNAYFELSKIYHPDRIAATDENLARFREISDAYEVLGNEHSRKLYDSGLVGDFKRPGMDDSAEITDPIIKFYKRRYDMTKAKSSEELDAWVKTYYKQAREKERLKSNFYTVSKTDRLQEYRPTAFPAVVITITLFLILSNVKGSKPEQWWNSMFNSEKKFGF